MCLDDGILECANYRAQVLCDDGTCVNGIGCGKRFVTTYHFDVMPTKFGFGVTLPTVIPKGSFLLYVGELIYEDKARSRNHDYIMELTTSTESNRTLFIDTTICGNEEAAFSPLLLSPSVSRDDTCDEALVAALSREQRLLFSFLRRFTSAIGVDRLVYHVCRPNDAKFISQFRPND
ncbi:hypothetical protein PHMEG_00024467 [Phytophthora megakarya]|uniref:Uncharacterized protein n=1 Tax=Phytophthora megakarya TaxID=4795 RepID=A0A225VGY4_9STRA|nr:hypothetical protein PHMEG_00024467 [Phytophthora megakarya]